MYEQFLNHESLIFFTCDQNGTLTRSEGDGLKLIGIKSGELVGHSAFHLGHDVPQNLVFLKKALAGETVEGVGVYANQTFDIKFGPLKGSDGQIEGMYGICINVTKRERARLHRDFLLFLGKLLSKPKDMVGCLESASRLALDVLGDYCLIDLADVHGRLRQVAVAHINPKKEDLLFELQRPYAFELDLNYPTYRVFRAAGVSYYPIVTDEMYVKNAKDETDLALYRALGPISVILVPIVANEKCYGVISLARSESGAHFSDEDVSVAEQFGRMIGHAIASNDFHIL